MHRDVDTRIRMMRAVRLSICIHKAILMRAVRLSICIHKAILPSPFAQDLIHLGHV